MYTVYKTSLLALHIIFLSPLMIMYPAQPTLIHFGSCPRVYETTYWNTLLKYKRVNRLISVRFYLWCTDLKQFWNFNLFLCYLNILSTHFKVIQIIFCMKK